MQAKRLIKQIYATCDNKVLKECYPLSGSNVCYYKPRQLYCGKQRGSVSVVQCTERHSKKKKTALGQAVNGIAV